MFRAEKQTDKHETNCRFSQFSESDRKILFLKDSLPKMFSCFCHQRAW